MTEVHNWRPHREKHPLRERKPSKSTNELRFYLVHVRVIVNRCASRSAYPGYDVPSFFTKWRGSGASCGPAM